MNEDPEWADHELPNDAYTKTLKHDDKLPFNRPLNLQEIGALSLILRWHAYNCNTDPELVYVAPLFDALHNFYAEITRPRHDH